MAGGRSIGAHDLLIAVTAIAHGYDVLTANARDFGVVPSLTASQPTWQEVRTFCLA